MQAYSLTDRLVSIYASQFFDRLLSIYANQYFESGLLWIPGYIASINIKQTPIALSTIRPDYM